MYYEVTSSTIYLNIVHLWETAEENNLETKHFSKSSLQNYLRSWASRFLHPSVNCDSTALSPTPFFLAQMPSTFCIPAATYFYKVVFVCIPRKTLKHPSLFVRSYNWNWCEATSSLLYQVTGGRTLQNLSKLDSLRGLISHTHPLLCY